MPTRFCPVRLLTVAALFLSTTLAGADEPSAEHLEFFEKKVRPLLAEKCQKCHGAATKQRAGLTLDSRSAVLRGGDSGPAVAPGDPEKSLLVKAVRYADPDLRMPPDTKLSQAQVADLEAWVRIGAPWPETGAGPKVANKVFNLDERRGHWSLQPVRRPELPAVKQTDWPLSPVDYFLLDKLEAAGLKPNPPADARTLVRRLHFDLIGLPPTPAEIANFELRIQDLRKQSGVDNLQSAIPQLAIEELVERLLASPHYGERWGRHWLDLVRYAETQGHEFDFELPDAWRYRDYVIRAFNADVPYDRFVTEHVAGDLLPEPRRHPQERFNESILGTGFWWLGEGKHSPVDIKGEGADRMDNQVDVFAKTFLGLTVACARCHDHMFDAISQQDYYALVGYLQSSRYQHAFIDDPVPLREKVAELREVRRQTESLAIPLAAAATRAKVERLPAALLNRGDDPDTARWLAEVDGDARNPLSAWRTLGKLPAERFAAERDRLVQGWRDSLHRDGPDAPRYETFADFGRHGYEGWFVTGEAFGTGPSGTEPVLRDDPHRPVASLAGFGAAHSGLVAEALAGVLRSRTFTTEKKQIHLLVRGRKARVRLILDGFQLIRNPIYGGLEVTVDHGDEPRWVTIDVGMWPGHLAYLEFHDDGPGWIGVERVLFADAGRPLWPTPNPLALRSVAAATSPADLAQKYRQLFLEVVGQWEGGKLAGLPDARDRVELMTWLLSSPILAGLPGAAPAAPATVTEDLRTLFQDVADLEKSLPGPRRALAMADGTGVNERLHIRGSHKNLGPEVPRRFLEVLGGVPADEVAFRPDDRRPVRAGSGRLALARRVASADNPLTARVMVNRVWKHHFGEGLVKSVDNFGVLGETPTHPELLDWLAAEFMAPSPPPPTSPTRERPRVTGWSLKHLHRLMVLSQAYQMSSRSRPEAKAVDPDNRLLHRMPVRRLEAEAIRDALLAVSGRLDPTPFGPSVPPHLTPFMTGRGRPGVSGPLDGNGRRSIYVNVRRNFLTPLFLVFDYPVPFSTMGRRGVSNVPAQALTLMNNPFVVQQAEAWSKKILAEPGLSPRQRLDRAFLTALGRPPSDAEAAPMLAFVRGGDPQSWRDLCHVIVNLKEFIYVQ